MRVLLLLISLVSFTFAQDKANVDKELSNSKTIVSDQKLEALNGKKIIVQIQHASGISQLELKVDNKEIDFIEFSKFIDIQSAKTVSINDRVDDRDIDLFDVFLSNYLNKGSILHHFEVVAPSTAVGGAFFNVTVRALDANDSLVTNYVGPILITTNGVGTNFPTTMRDSLFSSGTAGEATFLFSYDGNGTIQIHVEDSAQSIYFGDSEDIDVATPADHFDVVIPDPSNLQVGLPFDVTISAKDTGDAVLTSYVGTVNITTTYSSVTNLPSSIEFTPSENGVYVISNVTITQAGTGLIRASELNSASVIASYNFENNVEDQSGNGLDGTVNGNENYTTGINGQAILLDGNDHVDFGDVADPIDDTFSVSVWFNSSVTGTNNRIIFNKETLYEAAAGDVATYAFQPNWAWYGNTAVSTNNWHHMVVTYDGSNQRMYIDGTEAFSRAHTGNMGSNANTLKIGARGGTAGSGTGFFTGAIDEFAIYGTTLNAEEVTALYNSNLSVLSFASDTLTVSPTPILDHLEIEFSGSNFYNGTPFEMTVKGVDQYGNTLSNYNGPVLLTGNGTGTFSPSSIPETAFSEGTAGEATVLISYNRGETIQITATDSNDNSYNAVSSNIEFTDFADHFNVTIMDPTNLQVGAPFDIVITAKDTGDVTMTTFEGDVNITTTYASYSNLPSTASFTLSDNGSITLSNVVITSSGTGFIRVSDAGASTLVASINFNGNVEDRSVNEFDGSVFGDENYTTGINGQAILLDGNDHVDFGNVANPVDDSFSVSVWFNSSVTGTNSRIIFNKEALYEGAAGDVATYAFQPNWAWYGNTAVTTNTWHHMVVTYDGSNQRMYIDGSEAFSRAHTGNMGSNTQTLKIGARGGAAGSGTANFTGAIDEFAIFDGTLSPEDVTRLYNTKESSLTFSSDTLTVSPTPILDHLELSVSGSLFFNGSPFEMTVKGVDQYGNTLSNYEGPILLTTNGLGALSSTTINSSEFSSGTPGEATVLLSYDRGETISITATDSNDNSYNIVSDDLTFSNFADHFDVVVTNPSLLQMGVPFDIVVTAKDSNNATITTYEGSVNLSSTYTNINNLPTSIDFTLGDAGEITISNVVVNDLNAGTISVSVVTNSQLVAYYSFDNNVEDGSSNSFDGATNGNPTYTSGIRGQAISLDGNDHVDFGNVANPVDDTFSVSIWFNSSVNGTTGNILYNKENLYEASAGNTASYAFQPNWAWYGNIAASINNWHQMVVTYDGSFQRMYIDGAEVFSRAHTGNMGSNTNTLKVGARGGVPGSGSSYFTGLIDEFAIYDDALTPSDIQQLYLSGQSLLSYSSDTLTVSRITNAFADTVTAGTINNLTIYRPYDSFSETLTFASSDLSQSISNQVFADDSLVLAIEFQSEGIQTIIIAGDNMSDTVSVEVIPAALDSFHVALQASQTNLYAINSPLDISVTAVDSFGNVISDYTGTITFSSTALTSNLPSDYDYLGGDNGTKLFVDSVTFSQSSQNNRYVEVSDGTFTGRTATFNTVATAGVDRLVFTNITNPYTAGQVDSITITAVDISDNIVSYVGPIDITSSDDANSNFPQNSVDMVAGSVTIPVNFDVTGTKTLDAEDSFDSAINGTVDSIYVQANALRNYVLSTSESRIKSGSEIDYSITLRDSLNNIATNYIGDLTITSDAASSSYLFNPDFFVDFEDASFNDKINNTSPTNVGTVTITDGLNGNKAGEFSGANRLDYGDVMSAGGLTNFTVSVWFKPDVITSGGYLTVYGKENEYLASIDVNGTPGSIQYAFRPYWNYAGPSSVVTVDEWHHYVVTYDGAQQRVYLNGSLVGSRAQTGAMSTYATNLMLGSRNGGNNFDGQIDDMAVYQDRTLTLTEIQSIYDLKSKGSYPQTVSFSGSDLGQKTVPLVLDLLGETNVAISDGNVADSATVVVTPYTYELSITDTVTVGDDYDLTVIAKSISDSTASRTISSSSLTFTSSDGTAVLPSVYDFSGDVGTHTFSSEVTMLQPGNHTITVSDGEGGTGVANIFVLSNSDAAKYDVSINTSPVTAGNDFTVTVTAQDEGNNSIATYTGSITISISDPQGSYNDTTYTFELADAGSKIFNGFNFKTSGNQIVTVVDQNDVNINGADTVLVRSNVPVNISIENLTSSVTVGANYNPTVNARDAYNNISTSYLGTIELTSTDTTLQSTYNLGNQGSKTFSNIVFTTAGAQNVIVRDINNGAFTDTLAINVVAAGQATDFLINYPDTVIAGVDSGIIITAVDGFQNTITDYTGTINLSTTDTAALLGQMSYSFIGGDNGTHTFATGFEHRISGIQTITISDGANSLSTEHPVLVQASNPDTLIVSIASSQFYIENQSYDVTVTVRDTFNNIVLDYTNEVTLGISGSATGAAQNSPYTFQLADEGVYTFEPGINFTSAGTSVITASAAGITGETDSVLVTIEAQATKFSVTGYDDPVQVGVQDSIIVLAQTQTNATAKNYTGWVYLTSNDPSIVMVDSVEFLAADSGRVRVENIEMRTIGTRYIDVSDNSISGRQSGITVTAGALTTLDISSTESRLQSGESTAVTVVAKDNFGNTKTNFTGDITVTTDAGSSTYLYDPDFFVDFEDASFNDKVGNITPTNTGTVTITNGLNGNKAGEFNGSNRLDFGNVMSAGGLSNFTISVWFKADVVVGSGYFSVYGKENEYLAGVDVNGAASRIQYAWRPFWSYAGPAATVNADEWYHYVVTYDGTEQTVYINGNEIGSRAQTGAMSAYATNLMIGSRNGANQFDGQIDDMAIYQNRTLTAEEITNIYNLKTNTEYPRTISYSGSDFGQKITSFGFDLLGSTNLVFESGAVSDSIAFVITPYEYDLTIQDTVTVGDDYDLTVTAKSISDSTASRTVSSSSLTFTSSDGSATLPTTYDFSGDVGSHTFSSAVNFLTPGLQTITVDDGEGGTGVFSVFVQSNSDAAQYGVTINTSPVTAGNNFSVTVEAQDEGGNPIASYTGSIEISISDPQGTQSDTLYTFELADGGSKIFNNFNFKTAGNQIVTVVDQNDININGADTVLVRSNVPVNISIENLTNSVTVGANYNPSVNARDAYNNVSTSYLGTIEFTSTDTTLQKTYNLGDQGSKVFSNIVFTTAGNQTVVARDINNGSFTDTLVVNVVPAGQVTDFVINFPETVIAGVDSGIIITAVDGFQNPITGYTGNIQFSTTDTSAILNQSSYTFIGGDNGTHTFGSAFEHRTSGAQTITISDTTNNLSTNHALTVDPAAADTLIVEIANSAFYVENQSYDITVTVRDTFNNIVTDYTDEVTLGISGSASGSALNSPYTYQLSDEGVYTFEPGISFTGAGTSAITASALGISGETDSILVTAEAQATKFSVTGLDDPIQVGVQDSIIILAQTQTNATAKNYTGWAYLTSNDPNIIMVDSVEFLASDSGRVRVENIEMRTVGTFYIDADDTSISGRQSGITVTAGSLTSFVITPASSRLQSGETTAVTIIAKDTYGNTKTNFTGDVTLTSDAGVSSYLYAPDFFVDFEDASFNDKVGNITPTNTGTVIINDGLNGNKVGEFSGSNNLDFGNVMSAGGLSNFSISVWFKADVVTGAGYFSVYGKENEYLSGIDVNGANSRIQYAWRPFWDYSGPGYTVDADEWYHYVVTYDGARQRVYVNGTEVGSRAQTGVMTASANTLQIGARNNGNRFDGQIDDMAIYSGTTLSAEQIQTIYEVKSVANFPRTISFESSNFGTKVTNVAFSATGDHDLTVSRAAVNDFTSFEITPSTLELLDYSTSVDATDNFSLKLIAKTFDNDTSILQSSNISISFTSSDTAAVLPTTQTLTSADSGVIYLASAFQLKSAGKQVVNAILDDGTNQTTITTDSIQVNVSNAVSNLLVTTSGGLKQSGNYYDLTITARDASNNVVSNYDGLVSISTTDTNSLVELPNAGSYQFTGLENGTVTFSDALRLITSGSTTVTVTDDTLGYITGFSNETVIASAVEKLVLTTGSSTVTQGADFDLTVTARDTFNNVVTGYIDYITIQRDSNAVILSDSVYNFNTGDQGVKTFAGNQINQVGIYNIFLSDTVSNSDVSKDTLSLTVASNDSVSTFVFNTLPDTITAGVLYTDSIKALNGFGTLITSYNGTIIMSASDENATIADTSINLSNGVAELTDFILFPTVGSQSITVRDSANALLSTTKNIFVEHGEPVTYDITLPSDSLLTDGGYNFTVEVQDVNGNRATSYTGSVNISTSNSNSTIVETYTFTSGDAGLHTFVGGVTYSAISNSTSITVTDQSNGTITGTSSSFTVIGTPIVQISFDSLSVNNYYTDLFSTTNLTDTNLFVLRINNPSDSTMNLTGLNLSGSLSGGTFAQMMSNLSFVVDANYDSLFEESAEAGVSFNYASNVLQISNLNIAIPSNDSIHVALYGDVTGLEGQLRTASFSLTNVANITTTGTVSKSSESIPITSQTISIDLNANQGTMNATLGANNPSGVLIPNDVSNRIAYQFRLAVNDIETMALDSVIIGNSGSLDLSTTVSSANLIYDIDGDGTIDGGDNTLATTTDFTNNTVRFVDGDIDSIIQNTNRNYIVTLTLNGTAITSNTIILQLDTNSVSSRGGVSDALDRVTYSNDSIPGNTFTIENLMVMNEFALSQSGIEDNNVTDLTIMDWELISSAETSIITQLTVALTLSDGQNADDVVSSALLYVEKNNNNSYNVGVDSILKNSGVVSTVNGNLTFSGFVGNVTDTARWGVKVNLSGTGAPGSTFTSQIASTNQFTLSQGSLSSDNFPLTGRAFTLRGIILDFNTNAVSVPSQINIGAEIEMAGFDFTLNGGDAATSNWTALRVYNRSALGSESAGDVDSVKIYRIDGDTVLIGSNIMTNDGLGGYSDVPLFTTQSLPGTFDYLITYKINAGFSISNNVGLELNQDDFTLSIGGSTINNLPYTSSTDITLPVTISEFTGEGVEKGIKITLVTASEPEISTMHIVRKDSESGDETIVASYESNANVSHGGSYVFTDEDVEYAKVYTYSLEEELLNGAIYKHDVSFDVERLMPETIEIGAAYPNPFNPVTNIKINVPAQSRVNIVIYNLLGQVVKQELNKNYETGYNLYQWNGKNTNGNQVASGMYLVRVEVLTVSTKKRTIKTQKIVLMK